MDSPFDPGLQPERTLLAWHRTTLAVAVACAVAIRFTAPYFGSLAVVAGITGLSLAAVAYFWARYRYRHTHTTLRRNGSLPELSPWPLASLAAATAVLGLMAILFLASSIHF